MKQLDEKVAIITGASSGIGEAIAHAFAVAGCRVVLVSRSLEKLKAVRERLMKSESEIHEPLVLAADISSEDDVIDLFKNVIAAYNRIDILVNNAGIALGGLCEELELSAWQNVINTNVTGAFLCGREAFRVMKPQGGGRIINIGSVSAMVPRSNALPYTTSKFALKGMTHGMALEGRDYGISVGVIEPGNVHTPFWERNPNGQKIMQEEGAMDPSDIARVAMLMATLPPDVNMVESTLLPLSMPFLGRG
ncbi:MAG: SDR family NAD(P)-dependent oxidoreductase [Phycisphaerales bacterium]|nr:SDR family NAD(P)-dependent oxidoreductase [Phycisphaerales bacterium]